MGKFGHGLWGISWSIFVPINTRLTSRVHHHPMTKTRAELDAELDRLQEMLPKMIADLDESSIMDAFAGEAELIEAAAAPEDYEHVRGRLDCMLASQGLIPGDNEGEPCK